MARIKGGLNAKKRHNRNIKLAKRAAKTKNKQRFHSKKKK